MKKILKIAGIGCAGLIGLFIVFGVISGIIGALSDTDTTQENTENKSTIVDSLELKRRKKVEDSIAQINSERRKKAEEELSSFRKKEDEFEGTTFYQDPRTPYYTNVNFIYPYIGNKGNYYWLRLKFQYSADDWLFINHAIILVDGDKFTVTGNWERDNDTGIWEWLDMSVQDSEHLILERIANSKSAKIRYVGDKYYDDRTITSKEKSIIKKTLDIYDNLK